MLESTDEMGFNPAREGANTAKWMTKEGAAFHMGSFDQREIGAKLRKNTTMVWGPIRRRLNVRYCMVVEGGRVLTRKGSVGVMITESMWYYVGCGLLARV